jgi:thioredoxin 1
MNKIIIVIIGVLIVAGGIYAYSNNQKEGALAEQKAMMEKAAMEERAQMEEGDMQKTDEGTMMPKEGSGMMDKDDSAMADKGESMMKAGSYEAYSADKLARAETGDVVLFFHASWCPSCRGLNASIEGNLSSLPEGVSILKVNYDTETELKKKYGVTYQHTLVQVDKDGAMIKKWSGSSSLDALLTQIQ